MFEPYLKSFFVRSNDPTHIKLLKLDIMTNLANETCISTILREVQTYISSTDKQFVAAAIQAIGRYILYYFNGKCILILLFTDEKYKLYDLIMTHFTVI